MCVRSGWAPALLHCNVFLTGTFLAQERLSPGSPRLDPLWQAVPSHYSAIAYNYRGALSLFLRLQPASVLHLFRTTSEDDPCARDQFRVFKLYVESEIQRGERRILPDTYTALLKKNLHQCLQGLNPAFVCVAGVRCSFLRPQECASDKSMVGFYM